MRNDVQTAQDAAVGVTFAWEESPEARITNHPEVGSAMLEEATLTTLQQHGWPINEGETGIPDQERSSEPMDLAQGLSTVAERNMRDIEAIPSNLRRQFGDPDVEIEIGFVKSTAVRDASARRDLGLPDYRTTEAEAKAEAASARFRTARTALYVETMDTTVPPPPGMETPVAMERGHASARKAFGDDDIRTRRWAEYADEAWRDYGTQTRLEERQREVMLAPPEHVQNPSGYIEYVTDEILFDVPDSTDPNSTAKVKERKILRHAVGMALMGKGQVMGRQELDTDRLPTLADVREAAKSIIRRESNTMKNRGSAAAYSNLWASTIDGWGAYL